MFENTADKKYFNTYGGKFTIEVQENTPNAITRTAEKTGRKIHYLAYNRITGFVKSVKYRKHEHEGNTYRSVKIEMESKAGQFAIELNLFSRTTTAFFHVMESINPAIETRFDISRADKKDRLFISQPDETGRWQTLKWNYTKDNPGNRPPLKQRKKFDGEIEWDSTEQLQFFLEKLPMVNDTWESNYATQSMSMQQTAETMEVPEMDEMPDEEQQPQDDLPF